MMVFSITSQISAEKFVPLMQPVGHRRRGRGHAHRRSGLGVRLRRRMLLPLGPVPTAHALLIAAVFSALVWSWESNGQG
uniref:Uncharacterized protein n=1 Tax=Oryza punctata TaxID=4537 RepID=A0A0E0MD36_ORYPU